MDAAGCPSNLRHAQRDQLEVECATLEEQIRQLESEVTKKREVLVAKRLKRSYLAPVYTLPDDVWLEILEWAFVHPFPRCGNPRSTFTESPIALSHVSRRLRALALGLPNIWTCIHINPRQSPLYSNMLQEQLRRSKNKPISITFLCRGQTEKTLPMLSPGSFPSSEFTAHFGVCWKVLLLHAPRWRHLSFWAERDLIVKQLVKDPHVPRGDPLTFPQLEYLDICIGFEGMYAQPSYCSLNPIMQETPRLSVLRLRDVFPATQASMTLNNITRLTLVQLRVPLPKLEEMLMATAGTLSALLLDTVDLGRASIDGHTAHLSLPHLRRLVLKDVQPFDIFMRRFSSGAPNLTELEIGAPSPHNVHEFVNQTVRKSIVFSALKKLHLICFGDHEPITLFDPTLLGFFPVLEHVIIREGTGALFTWVTLEAIRHSLNMKGATSYSLPPLKKIWISEPEDEELFGVFMQVIARKAKLGCPFEEAVILQEPRRALGDDDGALEEGESEDELDGEKDIPSILRYEMDERYRGDANRFLEWEVSQLPCITFLDAG